MLYFNSKNISKCVFLHNSTVTLFFHRNLKVRKGQQYNIHNENVKIDNEENDFPERD